MSDNSPKKKRKHEKPDFSKSVDLSGFDHAPPHNLDAERGLIGALLNDPQLCDDIVPLVSANDFYSDANSRIYRNLVDMRTEGSAIDLVLFINRLKSREELEAIGGEAYLYEILLAGQITVHAEYYAKIVKEKSVLRELIRLSSNITREAFAPDTAVQALLDKASSELTGLCIAQTTNQVYDMQTAMQVVMDYIDRKMKNQSDGIPTGFYDLDKLIDGMHPSELIILAARPSVGKTAFAMNIAEHVAVDRKLAVLVVSLEMGVQELGARMVCSRGRINSHRFRTGTTSTGDYGRMMEVLGELSQAPLFFDDTPSRTVSQIAAIARRLKRQHDLKLMVIDYLGLIEPENPADPRQEQVAKIARRLKGLARELRIPILCLAQLNRATEMTKDNRPKLANLRESGAIEQDADVVMFVHREERYLSKEDAAKTDAAGKAEIIVAKQRNGAIDDVNLTWIGEYTRFENHSDHQTYEDPALYVDAPYTDDFPVDEPEGF